MKKIIVILLISVFSVLVISADMPEITRDTLIGAWLNIAPGIYLEDGDIVVYPFRYDEWEEIENSVTNLYGTEVNSYLSCIVRIFNADGTGEYQRRELFNGKNVLWDNKTFTFEYTDEPMVRETFTWAFIDGVLEIKLTNDIFYEKGRSLSNKDEREFEYSVEWKQNDYSDREISPNEYVLWLIDEGYYIPYTLEQF